MAILRRSIKVLVWLVASVVGLAVLLVLVAWLVFPWSWAADKGAEMLSERYGLGVAFADLDLDPFQSLEIRGLAVAPPEGFETIVLRVDRLAVTYDLSRVLSGELRIESLRIERPEVHLAERGGRFNVVALLDGFTARPDAEEPEPPAATDEPGGFTIRFADAVISDASLVVVHTGGRVELSGLNLRAHGEYGAGDSHITATLRVAPTDLEQPNLRLVQRSAEGEASLQTRLALGVRGTIEDLQKIQASVLLEGEDLIARSPVAPEIGARDLAFLAEGSLDLSGGEADLPRVSLALDGDELIAARGKVATLFDDPAISATVTRVALDLDRLGALAGPLLQGLRLGGRLDVRDLDIQGRASTIAAGHLPRASGEVRLQGVSLAMAALTLSGVNGRLDVTTDQARELPLAAQGRVRAARLAVAGLRLDDLALALDGGCTLDGQIETDLKLSVARLARGRDAQRVLAQRLELDAAAVADPAAGDLELRRLRLSVPGLLALSVEGRVRAMGEQLRARVRLAPTDLRRLLVALPADLKRHLPSLQLGGRLSLAADVSGSLPRRLLSGGRFDPLDLPLRATGNVVLDKVTARLPDLALGLDGLSGDLQFEGTPRSQSISGKLELASASKEDLKLVASDLTAECAVVVEGGAVEGRARVRSLKASGAAAGASLSGLDATVKGRYASAGLQATVKLSLDAVRLGELDLTAGGVSLDGQTTRNESGRLEASGTLRAKLVQDKRLPSAAKALALTFKGSHDSGTSEADFDLEVDAGRLGAAPVRFEGLGLKGQLTASDRGPEANLKLRVRSLDHPALGGVPLLGTLVDVDAALPPELDRVEIRGLSLRAPAKGLGLTLKGTVGRFDRSLPELDASMLLTLDAPRWISLYGGTTARGKGRLELVLRSQDDDAIGLSGDLRFEGLDASLPGQVKILGLQGSVPVRQRVRVQPDVVLLSGSEDVLKRKPRDIIYEQLRPYRRGRAGLRLARLEAAGHTVSDGELDLRLEDGTVALDRVQVTALGGSVVGDVALQLADNGTDLRAHAALQATSVDVGGLIGASFTGQQSQISGGLELKLGVNSRFLEADARLTKIGSKMLDRLLRYVDEDGRNASIVEIRRKLNEYELSPRLVAARVKHGNLTLDIKMNEAGLGLGSIAAKQIEEISRNNLRRVGIAGQGFMIDLFSSLDRVVAGIGKRGASPPPG